MKQSRRSDRLSMGLWSENSTSLAHSSSFMEKITQIITLLRLISSLRLSDRSNTSPHVTSTRPTDKLVSTII